MEKKAPTEKFAPGKADIAAWNEDIDRLSASDGLDDVMKTFACIVDHFEENHMDRLLCKTYRKALDWLATLKKDLSSFRAVEYETGCADSDGNLVPGTSHAMYMVYNTNTVSDGEASEILSSGRADIDPRVAVLWPSQAMALFPGLKNQPEDGAEEPGRRNADG